MRRVAFLVVGTLVLWYLGHFGVNALLQVVEPDLPAAASRTVDLLLVPLAVGVTWLVMRRLEAERGGSPRSGREPRRGPAGRNDAR